MPGAIAPGYASLAGTGAPLSADAAVRGRAQERTGLATQSALRQLREIMASRGMGGSGLEAHETGRLVASGLGDLAETDRQQAEAGAARSFQSTQTRHQQAIDAANAGLQAAMGTPGEMHHYGPTPNVGDATFGRTPVDPGTDEMDFSARNAAVAEARRQLQALTGYSAGY